MIEVKALSGGYNGKSIIKDMSFSLSDGELLFVIGPNGSGKTTLFKLMLGLLSKKNGEVVIDGEDSKEIKAEDFSKRIAYIPQQHEPVFDYTVMEMVLMGRTSHIGMFASPAKQDIEIAEKSLDMLSLGAFAQREYGKLSGGEMQMVLIARAVCQQAKTIIMDEPMMNLDYKNQAKVLGAIETLQDKGYSIIMSTHNMIYTGFKKAKVLLIRDGIAFGFGDAEKTLTEEMLQKVYDVAFDVMRFKDSQGTSRYVCIPL